jgi:hypothetical protein
MNDVLSEWMGSGENRRVMIQRVGEMVHITLTQGRNYARHAVTEDAWASDKEQCSKAAVAAFNADAGL